MFYSRETAVGLSEMAQSVKCLLSKYGDLSLIPEPTFKTITTNARGKISRFVGLAG